MLSRSTRDTLLRLHVGNLRISAVTACNTLTEMSRRWHEPSCSTSSGLWADYMAGTAMLSSFFKGEERIKLTLKAKTEEEIYVEAMAVGEVRGKAKLLKGNDWRTFAQGGVMQVEKILYGATRPYVTSVTALGDAETDFQTFYEISEQIPTRVRIDHTISGENQLHCCGLTVQKMPESALHDRVYDLGDLRFDDLPFSAVDLKNHQEMFAYIDALIPYANLNEAKLRKIPLDFYCRCSKRNFANRLGSLGANHLNDILQDCGESRLELTCHFCNELYPFTIQEVQNIRDTCVAT